MSIKEKIHEICISQNQKKIYTYEELNYIGY